VKNSIGLKEILENQKQNPQFLVEFDERVFYLEIAHTIGHLRQKNGLSLKDLASKSNVSMSIVTSLEKGDHRKLPTFDEIFKVLKVLGHKMTIHLSPLKKNAA